MKEQEWERMKAEKRRLERREEPEIRGWATGIFAEQGDMRPDIQGALLMAALILLLRMDNILFLENQTGSTPVAGWDAEA